MFDRFRGSVFFEAKCSIRSLKNDTNLWRFRYFRKRAKGELDRCNPIFKKICKQKGFSGFHVLWPGVVGDFGYL